MERTKWVSGYLDGLLPSEGEYTKTQRATHTQRGAHLAHCLLSCHIQAVLTVSAMPTLPSGPC